MLKSRLLGNICLNACWTCQCLMRIDNLPSEINSLSNGALRIILSNLGFDRSYWGQSIDTLSGGQYARVLVARALIVERCSTARWTEQPLRFANLALVRAISDGLENATWWFAWPRLLDHVTNCTWVLRDKKLQTFSQTCTQARKALAEKKDRWRWKTEVEQKRSTTA